MHLDGSISQSSCLKPLESLHGLPYANSEACVARVRLILQRVNKMKLDNPSYKTAEKVNLSSMRVDTNAINEHSRLHKTITDTCAGKMYLKATEARACAHAWLCSNN